MSLPDRAPKKTCMYLNVAGQKNPPILLLSSVPYKYIYINIQIYIHINIDIHIIYIFDGVFLVEETAMYNPIFMCIGSV